jgi:hypothetical protein
LIERKKPLKNKKRKSEKAQGKQKANDHPPWEERVGEETERAEMTDEEAIRVALEEDRGLVWLREQCKQNPHLPIPLLNHTL